MYEAYYNLSTAPFRLTPDHTFRFAHMSYSQVFARLEQAFHRGEGFVVLAGELGAGKTLMFNELFTKHVDERVRCARLTTTQLDSEELLRAIALEYGLECERAREEELLCRFKDFLQHQANDGHHCVLMIDEAQEMPRDAVARAAELSRLRAAGGRPLLQVFLAGPPEFARRLEQADAACELVGMDASETGRYIEHRLRRAGWQGDPKITVPALQAIHEQTRGIPRSINLVCSRLLLVGASEGKHELDAPDVTKVMEDLRKEIPLGPGYQAHLELVPLLQLDSEPATDPPAVQRQDLVSDIASDLPEEVEREIVRVPPRPAVPPAASTPSRAAAASAAYGRGSRMRIVRYAVAGSFLFAVALFAASYPGGFNSFRRLLGNDRAGTVTEQAAVAIERQAPAPEPTPPSVPAAAPNPDGANTASKEVVRPESPPQQSAQAGGDESGRSGPVPEGSVQAQGLSSEPAQAQSPAENGVPAGQPDIGPVPGDEGGAEDSGRRPKMKKAARGPNRLKHKAGVLPKKAQAQPKVEALAPLADKKTGRTFPGSKGQGADSSTNLEALRAKTAKFERPDIERPVIGWPGFERAEITPPDVERPDVSRPDAERPDISRPDVSRPDVERPDVERPNIDRAKVERPKIERPKIDRPKIERPKIERPKIERPKIERPERNK